MLYLPGVAKPFFPEQMCGIIKCNVNILSKNENNIARFWNIIFRLPFELQQLLSLRVETLSRDTLPTANVENMFHVVGNSLDNMNFFQSKSPFYYKGIRQGAG